MKRPLALSALGIVAAACSYDSCFVRGTRVRTPDRGLVPIESLRVGDRVLSPSLASMTIVERRVEALHIARATNVCILHIGAKRITTTATHPLWEAERRRWIPAGELEPGMTLVTHEMLPARLDRVEQQVVCREVDVFNLTVEGPEHTYFAEDIAVHNKTFPTGTPFKPEPESSLGDSSILALRNDTRADVQIGFVDTPSSGTLTIESALLARANEGIELPPGHLFGSIRETRRIPPGHLAQLATPSSRILIESRNATPNTAAGVFELEGQRYLAAGSGEIILARNSEGRIEPLIDVGGNATRLRLIALPKQRTMPTCATSSDPAVILSDKILELVGSEVVVSSSGSHPSLGCSLVRMRDETNTLDADVCVPSQTGGSLAWPFTIGDRLRVLRPAILAKPALRLVDASPWPVRGVRLERTSDGVVVELAQVTNDRGESSDLFEREMLFADEDTSCVVEPKPSCGTTTFRTRIMNEAGVELAPLSAPIDVKTGVAAVVRATKAPIAFDCEKTRASIDLIAWSKL